VTARLVTQRSIASRTSDVLARLVSAGVDVELVGGNGSPSSDELDPLGAVREGTVDLALVGVSALRGRAAEDLTTVAVLPREEFRDVVVDLAGAGRGLVGLSPDATVGVHGARRLALLRAHRREVDARSLPDVDARSLRGAVDGLDAVVVGAVEARLAGWSDEVTEALDPRSWLPAPGKGAHALVARHPIAEATALDHLPTRTALRTELALLDALEADPDAPVGSFAQTSGRWIRLWAGAASIDGRRLVRSDLTGPLDEPETLGAMVAKQLRERGVSIVLEEVGA